MMRSIYELSKKKTIEEELYHHGILGQKWGVRRFQNKDGTLTAEGRRHKEKKQLNKDNKLKRGYKKVATYMNDHPIETRAYIATAMFVAWKFQMFIGSPEGQAAIANGARMIHNGGVNLRAKVSGLNYM